MGMNARSAAINEKTGAYEGTREVTLEDCAKNRLDENNKYQQFTYTNHGQLKLVYVARQTRPICITVMRTTTDQNGPCNVDPMYPQFGSYLFAADCDEMTTTMSDGSSVIKALDTQTFFWNDNDGTLHIGCDHLFPIGVPTNVPNAGRQVVGVASRSLTDGWSTLTGLELHPDFHNFAKLLAEYGFSGNYHAASQSSYTQEKDATVSSYGVQETTTASQPITSGGGNSAASNGWNGGYDYSNYDSYGSNYESYTYEQYGSSIPASNYGSHLPSSSQKIEKGVMDPVNSNNGQTNAMIEVSTNIHGVHTILNNFVPGAMFDHGCWCAKFATAKKSYVGGKIVLDHLDEICKHWAMSRRCLKLPQGSCERSSNHLKYKVFMHTGINPKDTVFPAVACSSNYDQCARDMCMVDVAFLDKIRDYFTYNTQWTRILGNAQECVKGPNNPKSKHCEGQVPDLQIIVD